jgi:hypothetical protein
VNVELTAQFVKAALGKDVPEKIAETYAYRNDKSELTVDLSELEAPAVAKLKAHAIKSKDEPLFAKALRHIETFEKLILDPDSVKVGSLKSLAAAIRLYLMKTEHKFVFVQERDGNLVPYYVDEIKYNEPDARSGNPASVSLSGSAIRHGESEDLSKHWHHGDTGGKTVSQVLTEAKIFKETPELYAAYLKEVALLNELFPKLGHQFYATGYSVWSDANRYAIEALDRDGQPTRVVMDDAGDVDGESSNAKIKAGVHAVARTVFWKNGVRDDDDEGSIGIPIQPYVQVFDLIRHQHALVHVNQLKPYVYDKKLDQKLVLDPKNKAIINALVESAEDIMEDIVAGKTGGVVVICTGDPGTGKTLTAEVYSEFIGRPLYSVQCSQLGVDPASLEKELMLVLRRASRWGAVGLIDEADVYVHERGNDIDQNAIVGVLLRLLERYRGMIFLTSNRATVIDDAILSRAIAHVRYELPTRDQLIAIWKILSDNYKVKFTDAQIIELVQDYPGISGRNVKNLLKLATVVARKAKEPVSVATIEQVHSFIDLGKTR